MDVQAFKKKIKDFGLSEKAQNVLLINDINDASQFLNINVKKIYYTERRFKQTVDELTCFQDMLKRKSLELFEGEQFSTDSIELVQKEDNCKEDIVSSAIDKFIDEKGVPQRRYYIFDHLRGEFALKDIASALSVVTIFKNIGGGFYDRSQSWNQRSFDDLIPLLSDQVSEFARYLIGQNSNSYNLVMAYVFIHSMDKRGGISLFKLKNLFYDFYLSRHKKGQIVEFKTLKISRIGRLTENEIKNVTYADEPLFDFQISDFFQPFSWGNSKLRLKTNLAFEFANDLTRDVMLIILLKAIDDYYQEISPKMVSFKQTPEAPLEIQRSDPSKAKEKYGTEVFSDDFVTTSQRKSDIFQHLGGEFTPKNITSILSAEARFKSNRDGFYDRPQNWQHLTYKELIETLPVSVARLARYLISRNSTSYVSVMAFVFIQNMDEDASINVFKLDEMFYDFYLSRHKNDLVVEKENAMVSRVGELSKDKIKWTACPEPFRSLLASDTFKSISHDRLGLRKIIAEELANNNAKDVILIILLKIIDDYYQKISSNIASSEQKDEPSFEIKESCSVMLKESDRSKALSESLNAASQRGHYYCKHQGRKFVPENIAEMLSISETEFKCIGDAFYDRPQNWQHLTYKELIQLLPDSVAELARYLVSRNYTSCMQVMAFIFIRGMEEDFSIYIPKLNEMFNNFYLSRNKNNLVIEKKTAVVNQVNELTKNETKDMACRSASNDLLDSKFFENKSHGRLSLKTVLGKELSNNNVKDLMLLTLLKAIDDYYQKKSPKIASYVQNLEPPLEIPEFDPPKTKESDSQNDLPVDLNKTPQRRHYAFSNLGREFVSENVAVALSDTETGYKGHGEEFYNLPQNWQQLSCNDLIKLLPISVSDLARYLTHRNHISYALVMVFVFIRSMDEDASINIIKLDEKFYNFYFSMHKSNLVVEKDNAIMSQIGKLTKDKIKRIACPATLHSLLASGAFKNISHGILELKFNLVTELANNDVKDLMIITLLKAIDDYYQKIPSNIASHEQNPEPPLEIKKSCPPKLEEGYCSKALSGDPVTTSTDNSILNAEKLGDLKDSKRFELIQFIKSTKLSVRATNVIVQNCYSIEDCYSLNEKVLSDFKNCGRKTANEILDFFERIKTKENFIPPPTIKEQLKNPPTETSLSILPIFSSTKFEDLTVEDLHPDFHSSTKLIDVLLSIRTSHVLSAKGVKTIGEILLVRGSEFLTWKNFGKKSLNELKDIVRSLCLTGNYSPNNLVNKSAFIDYTSYENMISSFVEQCLKSKRDQELSKKRFCFQTGKVPTLEERGQYFGITRERVRQIVKKNSRNLKHRVNLIKLERLWVKLDSVVKSGGGIIHLRELPATLQTEFNWPTAPYFLALGQFLALRQPDANSTEDSNIITVECDCLSCDQVSQQMYSLDFAKHESFHIEVVGAKLSDNCQTQCPWNLPVKKFHKVFIERLIDKSEGRFVLHEDLVLSRSNWLNRYCERFEDVVCHVLECYGKPMHFSEIADHIRSQNQNFKEMSDHNVHASIIRYDKIKIVSRGTYGLKSWGLKRYRSVSSAIEEFIDAMELPQRKQNIIRHLEGEFNEGNIAAALSTETRFKSIGKGLYDRPQNWQQRTLDEFIQLLPESITEFVRYLMSRNNTSYKLVMAFVFIRGMDGHGTIYLSRLKKNFYNFYLSRYKKGLGVEVDTAAMSRIRELTENEIINRSCKEPLKSFLKSDFFILFSQNGKKLRLADFLAKELGSPSVRDVMLILLLKAIDIYYQKNIPMVIPYDQKPEIPLQIQEIASSKPKESDCPKVLSGDSNSTINIKKKRRGKIRL